MKRLLAIILTVLMLVSVLPISALAATVEGPRLSFAVGGSDLSCSEGEFKELLIEKPLLTKEESYDALDIDPKGWYYTHLSTSLQKIVYDGTANISPTKLTYEIAIDDLNGYIVGSTELEKAFDNLLPYIWTGMWCHRFDNPYICDSYTNSTGIAKYYYGYEKETGRVVKTYIVLALENHTFYNSQLITNRNKRIAEIADIASHESTPYLKLKAIYEEIIETSQYDYDSLNLGNQTERFYYAHNSLGILLNGEGVCESYAKAVKLVCDYMDIAPCVLFTSATHMWNGIYLDGAWYCLDATWDDPGAGSGVTYNYFLCGDPDVVDGASNAHTPETTYTIPPQYSNTAYNPNKVCTHSSVAIPEVPATCTKEGSRGGAKCSNCGVILIQPTIVPKKSHNTSYVYGTSATCESAGKISHYKCSSCQGLFADALGNTPVTSSSLVIPKKGHSLTYVAAKQPTYTSYGNIAHYKCTVCGKLFSDSTATKQLNENEVRIPMLVVNCSHELCTELSGYPATVDGDGLTDGLYCEICCSEIIEQQIIPRIDTIKLSKDKYTYTGKTIKPGVVVTDELGVVIPSSNYTLSYSSGLKLPGTYTVTVTFKGNYSGAHKLSYKIIITAPSPKASTSTSSVKLSWGKVSGASGYVVYDANKKTIKDVKTATSYTISKRKAGTTYSYYVRTYKTISGKKYYSDYVKVTSSTLPSNPKVSASSSASAIKYTWGKVSGATGYEVYNGSKKVIKDCGNTTTYTLSGRKAGTSYSVYMRAYRTVSGKRYYSSYVKVTYSTKPANPAVTTSSSTSSVKLSWGKVSGASGYIVYDANKKKLSDRKTSTSYSISSRKAGTTYTYYVRAYRKASGATLYSDYVKVTCSTLPANPKVSASSTSSSIKYSWGKVSGATGYEVYNGSKAVIKDCGSSTSYTLSSLTTGKAYSVYIRAYRTVSGKRYYSSYVKVSYATKPTFNDSSVTVGVGKTYKLSLNTTASSVTWATSNKSIATVNSSGVVTGKKKGTVTITATANGQKATIKVNVTTVSFKINETSYTMWPDYTYRLTVTTNVTNPTITWSSSNPNVATVNSGGYVWALSEGQTVITVTLNYGGVTYKQTCVVTVEIPTYTKYGFDTVPDFAAAVGNQITPKKVTYTYGEEACLEYRGIDIDWDEQYELSLDIYRDYLSQKGFQYINTVTGGSAVWGCTIETYQNDSAGILVEFVHWKEDDSIEIYISKYKITLSDTSINLKPGYYATISAETTIGGNTIWWSSSNPSVAYIEIEDDEVRIVAEKEGTATVTAYFECGGIRYSATCKVTVKIPTYADYGYAEVPDFAGAVGSDIKPANIYERTDETEFMYKYSDINWDGDYDITMDIYRDYLSLKGFSYVTTTTGTQGEWTYEAEYYQNTTTKTRMIFVRWSDGDVSIIMWHY